MSFQDSALEVDPSILVHSVLEASDASDESAEAILCGAARQLRSFRNGKPDPILALGLMSIVKIEPCVFRSENVQSAFGSLLRPTDAVASVAAGLAPGYKTNKSGVAVLAANLMMLSHMVRQIFQLSLFHARVSFFGVFLTNFKII